MKATVIFGLLSLLLVSEATASKGIGCDICQILTGTLEDLLIGGHTIDEAIQMADQVKQQLQFSRKKWLGQSHWISHFIHYLF